MLLKLLLMFSLPALICSDMTTILNKLVDDIVELASTELEPEINLKLVSFPYTYNWLMINKSGIVNCDNGIFQSLKSLKRTGNVNLTMDQTDKITIKTAMGMEDLEFTFDTCTIDWFMIPRGPLHGKIGQNSLSVEFVLQIGHPDAKGNVNSVVTVKHVSLDLYKNVKMALQGKGVLHWIEEKILNFVANGDAAKNMLNNVIENQFRKQLPKFEILIKPLVQFQSP
uniref:Putative secreted protein n=1 Tax=Panstrongylus lignarius TaxID=156445 RepID=A0A224XS49_9HEMI